MKYLLDNYLLLLRNGLKNMERKLAESANYKVFYEYESVFLVLKERNRKILIGDFYGDPECAVITDDEMYCIMGGYGLILYRLEEPFESFKYNIRTNQWEEIMREKGKELWIEHLYKTSSNYLIKFTARENNDNTVEIYELNLETKIINRLENKNA